MITDVSSPTGPSFADPFVSCEEGVPSLTEAASSFCNFIPQVGTVITETDAILSSFIADTLETLEVPSGGSTQNVIDKAFGDIAGLVLDPIFDEVAEGASELVNDVIQARFTVPSQPGACIPTAQDPCTTNPDGAGCLCPVLPYRTNENGCGLPTAIIDFYLFNTSNVALTRITDTIALELNNQSISLPEQTRWLQRLPSTIPANATTPVFGRAAVNGDLLCYLGSSAMRVNVVYTGEGSNNIITIEARRQAPEASDVGCIGQGCPSGFGAVSENTVQLSSSNASALNASFRKPPQETQVQVTVSGGSGGNGGNGGNGGITNNTVLIGILVGAGIVFLIFIVLLIVLV
jgi:hypothetical protein